MRVDLRRVETFLPHERLGPMGRTFALTANAEQVNVVANDMSDVDCRRLVRETPPGRYARPGSASAPPSFTAFRRPRNIPPRSRRPCRRSAAGSPRPRPHYAHSRHDPHQAPAPIFNRLSRVPRQEHRRCPQRLRNRDRHQPDRPRPRHHHTFAPPPARRVRSTRTSPSPAVTTSVASSSDISSSIWISVLM